MIKKQIKVIIDEKGDYVVSPIGTLTANDEYSSSIQVITPFPRDNIIMVGYNVRDSVDDVASQFLIPQNKKGFEEVDKNASYYQKVSNWNVFEVDIDSKALAYISKFKGGLVSMSFTVSEQQIPSTAVNYKGRFSVNSLLPEEAQNGDYYICDTYNLKDKGITWTLNDIAVYQDGWEKATYYAKAGTEPQDFPVDANIPTNIEVTADMDLAVLLAGRVAVLEERVDGLQATGTRWFPTGWEFDKVNEMFIPKSQIDIGTQKIVKGDLLISKNADSNGYVAVVLDVVDTVVRAKYNFTLEGSIANKTTNLVFDTLTDLTLWIEGSFERPDGKTRTDLFIGQNIYLVEENVPDYWVSKLPVNSISDFSILEGKQNWDRTFVGESEPDIYGKYNIWLDTSTIPDEPYDPGEITPPIDPEPIIESVEETENIEEQVLQEEVKI